MDMATRVQILAQAVGFSTYGIRLKKWIWLPEFKCWTRLFAFQHMVFALRNGYGNPSSNAGPGCLLFNIWYSP